MCPISGSLNNTVDSVLLTNVADSNIFLSEPNPDPTPLCSNLVRLWQHVNDNVSRGLIQYVEIL